MIKPQRFQDEKIIIKLNSVKLFEKKKCSTNLEYIRYFANRWTERVRDLRNWECRISRCSREPWLRASRRASDAAVAAAVFARLLHPSTTRLGGGPPSLSSPLPRSSPSKPSKINYSCPLVLGWFLFFSGLARGHHVCGYARLFVERSRWNLCPVLVWPNLSPHR